MMMSGVSSSHLCCWQVLAMFRLYNQTPLVNMFVAHHWSYLHLTAGEGWCQGYALIHPIKLEALLPPAPEDSTQGGSDKGGLQALLRWLGGLTWSGTRT
jgi:hypothetical protein